MYGVVLIDESDRCLLLLREKMEVQNGFSHRPVKVALPLLTRGATEGRDRVNCPTRFTRRR